MLSKPSHQLTKLTISTNGNIHLVSRTVSLYRSEPTSYPGANARTSHGAHRMPAVQIMVHITTKATKIPPLIRWAVSVPSWASASVSAGTITPVSPSSATNRRKTVGIVKAIQKLSAVLPSPKTLPKTMSRAAPKNREKAVPAAEEIAPR